MVGYTEAILRESTSVLPVTHYCLPKLVQAACAKSIAPTDTQLKRDVALQGTFAVFIGNQFHR
jgi:hypothetical protein